MNKKKIRNYFFELLIIFIGVTTSFLLNEWRENRKNSEEEKIYLENLRNDLVTDTISIQNEINGLKRIIYSCKKGLRYNPKNVISQDSIGLYLHLILQYSVIPIQNITYKTLIRTGDSQLISNRNLLRKIIELYEVGYFNIREYNKIDENLILTRLIPYYEENFEFYGSANFGKTPLNLNFKFKNLVKSNLKFKEIQIALYKQQISNIHKLIKAIDLELAKG